MNDFKIYQEKAHSTAIYSNDFKHILFKSDNLTHKEEQQLIRTFEASHLGTAIAGEVGEVCNLLNKFSRGDTSFRVTTELQNKLTDELGGVLWYISEICAIFNIELQEVAEKNISLLSKRNENNELKQLNRK